MVSGAAAALLEVRGFAEVSGMFTCVAVASSEAGALATVRGKFAAVVGVAGAAGRLDVAGAAASLAVFAASAALIASAASGSALAKQRT